MIENFTAIYEEAYNNDLDESITEKDVAFERKIKQNIQSLGKEPSKSVIDNILAYSKSLISK